MSTTDPRLEKLRQKFEEQKAKDDERKNSEMGFYPFFNIDFGTEAILRFLPDTNPENYDLFLIKNNSQRFHVYRTMVNLVLFVKHPKHFTRRKAKSQKMVNSTGVKKHIWHE